MKPGHMSDEAIRELEEQFRHQPEVFTARPRRRAPRQAPEGAMLTLEELAASLQVEPTAVYTMTRTRFAVRTNALCERVGLEPIGALPHTRCGKELRFDRQRVQAWLEKREQLEARLQAQPKLGRKRRRVCHTRTAR